MVNQIAFSKHQLHLFSIHGWKVFETDEEKLVSIVKYPLSKPLTPTLIQLDYRNNKMLVIEQNIALYQEQKIPVFCGPLPESINNIIWMLDACHVVHPSLINQLYNEND